MTELEKKAFWVKVPIIGGNPNIQVVTLEDVEQVISEWQAAYDEVKQKLEDLQKSLALQEQFDHDYDMQISENDKLKNKLEAANKIIDHALADKEMPRLWRNFFTQIKAILSQDSVASQKPMIGMIPQNHLPCKELSEPVPEGVKAELKRCLSQEGIKEKR